MKVKVWGWCLVFGARVNFFLRVGGCGLLLGFVLRIGYRVTAMGFYRRDGKNVKS